MKNNLISQIKKCYNFQTKSVIHKKANSVKFNTSLNLPLFEDQGGEAAGAADNS